MWRQQENHKLSAEQVKAGRDGGEHRADSFTLKMPTWIKFSRGWRCVVSMLQKPGEPQLRASFCNHGRVSDGRGRESQSQANAQATIVHINVLEKGFPCLGFKLSCEHKDPWDAIQHCLCVDCRRGKTSPQETA